MIDRGCTLVKTTRSGSIQSAGVAQVICPANASRNSFALQNTSTYTLYLRNDGTLATSDGASIAIPAGALFEEPAHAVSAQAISLLCLTAGATYYAEES
jgi:hypothetical protein